jgi:hypothetical protein
MRRPAGIGISFVASGLILDFALRHIWQFEDVFPFVGILGFYLFPAGIFLLLCSAWSWLQRRQEPTFLTKLSISAPEDR